MADTPVEPVEPTAPIRRPIFASLAIIIAIMQLCALWWIQGPGARQLFEDVIHTGNGALLIMAPIMWAVIGMGIFAAGMAFLGVALWRQERPVGVLWLAGGLLLLAPMILVSGDFVPKLHGSSMQQTVFV